MTSPSSMPDTFLTELLYSRFLLCDGVSVDTRTVQAGQLFFALKGEHYDGNTFATTALDKGASYAVIDNKAAKKDDRYLLVPHALEALQALARFHRRRYKRHLLAITGSNGKTTTKALVHAVLNKKYSCIANVGNLNNHIGVPLTLLSIHPQVEIAILELASSHPGEMKQLCEMARPTHGLITNTADAHLEGFKSPEGVYTEKKVLFDNIAQAQGVFFLNTLQDNLHGLKQQSPPATMVSFPHKEDTYPITCQQREPHLQFSIQPPGTGTSPLMGAHNFENIACACAIGRHFDVPIDDIYTAIAAYTPTNNRSERIQKGTNTIWLDAYNANPSAMRAVLESFLALDNAPKALILGDMLELGHHAQTAHMRLGSYLAQQAVDSILLCGKTMRHAHKEVPTSLHFDTKEALQTYLQEHPFQHTHILIKASRGLALETVLEYL